MWRWRKALRQLLISPRKENHDVTYQQGVGPLHAECEDLNPEDRFHVFAVQPHDDLLSVGVIDSIAFTRMEPIPASTQSETASSPLPSCQPVLGVPLGRCHRTLRFLVASPAPP